MLYPELRVQPSELTEAPPAPPTPALALEGEWILQCRHPTQPRVCVAIGAPPDDRLHELWLETGERVALPFPPGASAQYIGASGLAVLVDDELLLHEHHFRQAPRLVHRIAGTYPGRLVEVVGDILVLAGDEAPWAFFRCREDRLVPLGEISPDGLRIFERFVAEGRLHLVGRDVGHEALVVEPIFEPLIVEPPVSVGTFWYSEAWLGVHAFPCDARRWTGTRDYQHVVASVLADVGLCLVSGQGDPTTLLLWFRDRSRSVSLLAIPDQQIDAGARPALDALDGTHLDEEASLEPVLSVVEPFWPFTLTQIGELTTDEAEPAEPARVDGRITHVVRLRTP